MLKEERKALCKKCKSKINKIIAKYKRNQRKLKKMSCSDCGLIGYMSEGDSHICQSNNQEKKYETNN